MLGAVDGAAADAATDATPGAAERWIISRAQRTSAGAAQHFAAYRFDLLVEELTTLLRDDFCDWYIELAKVSLAAGGSAAAATRATLLDTLGTILRLAHPLIPFVTAQLWQHVGPQVMPDVPDIIKAPYPVADPARHDHDAEASVAALQGFVHRCRSMRALLGVDPGRRIKAVLAGEGSGLDGWLAAAGRLARLEPLEMAATVGEPGTDPVLTTATWRLRLELGEAGAGWRERLGTRRDAMAATKAKLEAKLANAGFTGHAPADVVTAHRDRLAALAAELAGLEELL